MMIVNLCKLERLMYAIVFTVADNCGSCISAVRARVFLIEGNQTHAGVISGTTFSHPEPLTTIEDRSLVTMNSPRLDVYPAVQFTHTQPENFTGSSKRGLIPTWHRERILDWYRPAQSGLINCHTLSAGLVEEQRSLWPV